MSDNRSYFKSKRFRAILQEYEEADRQDIPCIISSYDYVDVAEYYQDVKNDTEKAERAIDKAVALYPGETGPLIFKGRLMLLVHHDIAQTRYYLSCIEDKRDLDYYYLVAEILLHEEKVDEANDYLKEMYEEVNDDERQDYIYDVANIFLDYFYHEIADEWIQMIDDKEGTDYKELMSKSLVCKGRYEESEETLNKLIDKDPFSNDYWNLLTLTQLRSEKNEEALSSSEFSIALNPDDDEAILNKAYALFQMGNVEDSVRFFQRYTELCPDDELGYFNVGSCMIMLNRYEEAWDSLKKAEKLSPEDSPRYLDIFQNLLYLAEKLEKEKEKVYYIKKIVEYPDDDIQVLIEKGGIFLYHGLLDKAQEYFNEAVEKSDYATDVIMQIGMMVTDNEYTFNDDGRLIKMRNRE
ncbi:MAG: hypothetical protein J6Z18_03520 [Prevotella sp.]|nr:hypothetical protein [Prevotella sp.]